ncbi:ABC transporter permease [Streptomyces sp. NPDC020747]|uniref:ABC transporter permease n=1 Tax=Streptomyces sp. NPDC020747 TaxID=3365086 RepID=UPI00379DD759
MRPGRRAARRIRPVRLPPRDVLALGMLGIRTRKVRAALSALGISLGIATMIVVTAIPASSQKALLERLSALGTNMLTAQAQPDLKPPVLLSEESVGMVARIGPVTGVSAVANTHAVVNRSDKVDPATYAGLTVLAAKNNLLPLINARVQSGHFLDRTSDKYPTAVLGSVAASRLGLPSVSPGGPAPQIYINHRWFTVVGVLEQTPLSPDIDRSVLVPWQPARTELDFDGRPTLIYVKAEEPRIEAVRDVLADTINPGLPGVIRVSHPSDALAAKRDTQTTFSALFLGLAGVALVVGGVGVANTMVVSVLERRREIGLRRALGATRGHIRLQFLTESVALSTLGGLAGTVLGVLATLAYTAYQGWPPVIPLAAVAGGAAGTVLVGAIAGLYPSLRAARMSPTEALASS